MYQGDDRGDEDDDDDEVVFFPLKHEKTMPQHRLEGSSNWRDLFQMKCTPDIWGQI